MALKIIPASEIDRDSYIFEPFGVRGAAEAFLRMLVQTGTQFAYASYSPTAAASIRKAAKILGESENLNFVVEKAGKTHREVTIVRKAANGKKGFSFTRTYLNTELVSVENLNIEADEN